MRIPVEISGASIVMMGHFNPIIFRPEWFRDKSILIGNDFASLSRQDRGTTEICHSVALNLGYLDREATSIE